MSAPRIGLAWGDHPWSSPPGRVGKLLSMGAVHRNLQHVLEGFAREVRPWTATSAADADLLDRHLDGLDIFFGDLYSSTFPFLQRRHDENHSWRAVILAHGNLPKAGDPLLTQAPHLLRPGDGIVFTSSADRAIWHRLVSASRLVESVVPLAVDGATFSPTPTAGDDLLRDRFGIPRDVPLLLFVGRHNIQKNLHGLLDVLAEVRRHLPTTQLALAGEPDDIWLAEFQVANSGYLSYLASRAEALGVASAVHFCGPVLGDDLAALYRTADLVVNLGFYHRENFGLSQAEAQACGTPVVCSAWGGFRDVVKDGETGILVDAVMTRNGIRVSSTDASDAIVALLVDQARRQQMSANAAAHAATELSVERLGSRLQRVVEGVRSAPAGPGPAIEPTDLARRYVRHATAHGWMDPDDDGWESPMYGGDDYAIYRDLLEPYSSKNAIDSDTGDVHASWVPVRASEWDLDHDRRLLCDLDPVWPHRKFMTPEAWDLLVHINGRRDIVDLAGAASLTVPDATHIVARLHREGFVLFRAPVPRP